MKEKNLSYIEKGLVYSLIYGNIVSVKEIWELIHLLGQSAVPTMALVIHFDNLEFLGHNKSEQWKRELRSSVYSLIKKLLEKEPILSSLVGSKRAVLLYSSLGGKTKALEESMDLAEKVKAYLEEKTSLQISIGIGGYYHDPRSLDLSYQEALYVLGQSFFAGESQIYCSGEIRPYQEEEPGYNGQMVEALKTWIQQGDREEALEILNQIVDALSQEAVTPSRFRMQAMELLFVLSRAVSQFGIVREDLYPMDLQYAERILSTTIVSSVKKTLQEALNAYMEIFMSRHNNAHLRLVNRAMDYMEKNYAQDLTLHEVASNVHLSPYYFSRIFKQETGITFLEYLSRIRMERAKRLLVDGAIPIGEVAAQVGYPNQNYFSRIFKKEIGLTPSEYKGRF